ncbi:MAG: Uma2 family endonuclease [Hyphomicrobiales bacterium]|nr:Uma2 family endonuclease [Hyphomicrobiales bacterium]
MIVPNLNADLRMTVEEFLAFTDSRPDEERWELIEGVPVLNASPTNYHQMICDNVVRYLMNHAEAHDCAWVALSGTGMRVPASPHSLPWPDIQVLPEIPIGDATPVAEDAVFIFDVLSKSDRAGTIAWKRRAYASIASCRHVVTIAQATCLVVRYDRDDDWAGHRITAIGDDLELPALALAIPLQRIYRGIPLKPPSRRSR